MHTKFYPLELKSDMADAARRWEAFWQGEMLDRPLLWLTCPKENYHFKPASTYHERNLGDLDDILDRALHNLHGTVFGAESLPTFWTSFGTDELGVYCGAHFVFGDDPKAVTVWCDHPVEDWESWLPLKIDGNNPAYLRMQEFYKKAEKKLGGKALLFNCDCHGNMDLLASMRGSERLCMDLYDQPELIDRAVQDACAVFKEAWTTLAKLARSDKYGYFQNCFSPTPCHELASDFSALMSTEMFKRWVLPCLEFESEVVGRATYHWDGPDAIKHADMLFGIDRIKIFYFVPSPGKKHIQHLDLHKRIQDAGKSTIVSADFEEAKLMHKELDPARTAYAIGVKNQKEIEDVIGWFRKNT